MVGGLQQHHVVELQALGQRGRDQVEPGVEDLRRPRRAGRTRGRRLLQRRRTRCTRRPATISPIVPSRLSARSSGLDQRALRATVSAADPGRRGAGGPSAAGSVSGAMCGSSRAAKSITAPGTRKPATSSSTSRLGVAEVGQRLRPGTGGPRGGRLGEVAEHGDRAGAGPAADRAQHHRRQVLGLVEDHVAQAGRALQQVGGLVDQDRVGQRPAGRGRPSGPAGSA